MMVIFRHILWTDLLHFFLPENEMAMTQLKSEYIFWEKQNKKIVKTWDWQIPGKNMGKKLKQGGQVNYFSFPLSRKKHS